jgi:hypothetical protein
MGDNQATSISSSRPEAKRLAPSDGPNREPGIDAGG